MTAAALASMKARDLRPEIDWGTEAPFARLGAYLTEAYVAEPKLDGCRLRIRIGSHGAHLTTGIDRTGNFPHLAAIGSPELAGYVLDGELVAPSHRIRTTSGTWTDSLLNASTAIVNSGPANAVRLQSACGPAQLWVFDVVSAPGIGEDVQKLPWTERREILELVVQLAGAQFPDAQLRLVPAYPARAEVVAASIAHGFEGVMLKRKTSAYKPGTRSDWLKIKTQSTADAFITGYEPGKDGWAGAVGALKLAVHNADGSYWDVASVGNLTDAFRAEISGPDGALKPEWYGVVIEFMAQGITSGLRARHPFMLRVRPDKTPAECGADQLDIFPRV